MTKVELYKYFDKKYVELKKLLEYDDSDMPNIVLIDVFTEILSYSRDQKLVIPGYDLDEIFAQWSLEEGVDDFNPDEVVRTWDVYSDITFKMAQKEIVVPPEFAEINEYFERLFWPDIFEEEEKTFCKYYP
jgi:hypothetical protein